MAERHSSQNGQHGGPGMPVFYGVICSMGLMGAALVILMTGQIFSAHPMTNSFHASLTKTAIIFGSDASSLNSGNKQSTNLAAE